MAVSGEAPHLKSPKPNISIGCRRIPTEGLVINFQMSVPITGAIISGKMSTIRKNLERKFSSFSKSATPTPSSISTVVQKKAYWTVILEFLQSLNDSISVRMLIEHHDQFGAGRLFPIKVALASG